jgi:hypothetical protein
VEIGSIARVWDVAVALISGGLASRWVGAARYYGFPRRRELVPSGLAAGRSVRLLRQTRPRYMLRTQAELGWYEGNRGAVAACGGRAPVFFLS